MSENYETIHNQDELSIGDRVRVTIEGTVEDVLKDEGTRILDDSGYRHEVFHGPYSRNTNMVRLVREPELAPGQLWRGGDFHFVVVGETNPVLVDVKDIDHWYRKTEFFDHFKNRNELLQEPV